MNLLLARSVDARLPEKAQAPLLLRQGCWWQELRHRSAGHAAGSQGAGAPADVMHAHLAQINASINGFSELADTPCCRAGVPAPCVAGKHRTFLIVTPT